MPLPRPADLTSLVLRTDFTDPAAWHALGAAIDAADEYLTATCVSDRRFDGADPRALVAENAGAEDAEKVPEVFLADATTLSDPSFPLLAVDLSGEPGRSFRVRAEWFPGLAAGLGVPDGGFAARARLVDASGVLRREPGGAGG
jgi:hypothetical protein